MIDKVKQIRIDLDKYKDYDYNQSVKDRLNKTLSMYLEELNKSYTRIRCKDTKYVMKEVSR